ncbi:hypothetical protein F5880DRAFT_1521396 [Lentinula raphanica]|nr:hypothetical protein F5880DRAFT_1521396 [Lentinula raphanica]
MAQVPSFSSSVFQTNSLRFLYPTGGYVELVCLLSLPKSRSIMMRMRKNWRSILRFVHNLPTLRFMYIAVDSVFDVYRTLVLGSSSEITEAGERIISLILPQLEQLPNVELGGCSKRTELLKTILAHPTVTSVLVDGLPNESMCSHDLSKVTLNLTSSLSTSLEKYFDRGMRLKCLSLCLCFDLDSLDNEVGTLDFTGLETIEVHIHSESVSFSWLSRFLSTHPTLNELWLLEIERNLFAHDAPPFFSLVEEYQPQGLDDLFIISKVGLRRVKPVDESSQEWHVMELTFRTNDLLIKKLSLLAASFPQLEILKLELDFGMEKYDVVRHLFHSLTHAESVLESRLIFVPHLRSSHL